MADTIFHILKISVIVAICATFLVAIHTLILTIGSIIFGSVVGEVMGIVSNCLPFDAYLVFGGLFTATSGILSFLIAKKIFDLTSWSISTI